MPYSGSFNAKVRREDILKPTSCYESLHRISVDNGVRVVNFAITKNLIVKSTMLPHSNIHKFTGHLLMERLTLKLTIFWQLGDSIQVYLISSCSGEQTVIITSIWWWQKLGKLSVSKQTMHGFHMERFNHKKLNEVQGKEQYWVEISNRFAAFGNLDSEVDINRALETIRENIKISA
jgi:hypothetical protein